MADPAIETFKGPAPKCRFCGKPLKPNYQSKSRGVGEPHIRFRRVYLKTQDRDSYPANRFVADALPDDPTVSTEEFDKDIHRRVGWDAKKQDWYWLEGVDHVKSRKFLGTFGNRGDSLFCMTECGYRWAVARIRKIQQGDK